MQPDNRWIWLEKSAIAILLVAIACESVAVIRSPFRGYDTYSHIFWIAEWHRMWSAGIFYPRWLPDSFAGFGAPSFYFYPPFTFFITSTLYAALPLLSAAAIGKTVGLLAFAGSGFAMWLYLRRRDPVCRKSQLFAALLYTFAPYHFFDYSVRGALPEHVALIFIPLVFWGIDLLIEERAPQDLRHGVLLLTISFALLVLCNLPCTMVTGLGAIVYVIARRTKLRKIGILAACAVSSILLTAFYLLPIAMLFSQVQFDRLWQFTSVVLSSPFIAIFSGKDLMINSYAMLSLIGACMLLAGYWVRRAEPESARNSSGAFWMLLFIVVLQFPYISQFLFNFVPPFTIIQLASRLSVLVLFIAAVSWDSEFQVRSDIPGKNTFATHAASLVVIVWSIGTVGLATLQLANIHVHQQALLPIGEAPEYAPRWSRPYYDFGVALSAPFATDSTWAVWRGKIQPSRFSKTRALYSDTIDYIATTPGSILLRRSYWPAWVAKLDGKPTPTAPDSLGRLVIAAPAGGWHRITTELTPEPSAVTGAWISVAMVVIAGILLLIL